MLGDIISLTGFNDFKTEVDMTINRYYTSKDNVEGQANRIEPVKL